LPSEIRKAYKAPYDSWRNRIAILRFVQDIPLTPEDESYSIVAETDRRLSSLAELPTLICWGEKDFVFDDTFLSEWRRRIPRAEVHVFPDSGHNVLEDAEEEVIPLVKDFLTRHPLRAKVR
jgi:haloalkane dehalogenase